MDIRDVSTEVRRSANKALVSKTNTQAHSKSSKAQSKAGDLYLESGGHGRVRSLVDRLAESPEIRPEVVERARALLEAGELDSPERFEQAARGFRGDIDHFDS